MDIVTKEVLPPGPTKIRYLAYRDNYEAGNPVGFGETEEEAIKELKEIEECK